MSAVPMEGLTRQQLQTEADDVLARANALIVTDAASYRDAAEFGKGIAFLQKKIETFFAPHVKRAHEAWKGLTEDRAKQLEPGARARAIVDRKMLAWKAEEDRRQQQLERERREAAKRLEEERRLQEAVDVEEEEGTAAALAVLDDPVVAPFVPAAPKSVPKISGVTTRKRWTFDEESIDLGELVAFVAANPQFLGLLQPNTKAIRSLVTSMGSGFKVPGIPTYEAESLAFGGRE